MGWLLGSVEATAQATNPPYLAQFPSTSRVRAELKGSDPVDSSARVMAAWMQLQGIIKTLSGPRTASVQYTPDENSLTSEYGSAWQRGLYLVNLPPEKDRVRWNQLRSKYEKDAAFLDNLLQHFFSAEFRLAYYQAIGRPAPGAVAAKPAPPASPAPSPPPASPQREVDRMAAATFAGAHLADGDRYQKAKDYTKAIEEYRKVISVDSTSARAHAGLAFCYFMLEQYERALPAYQMAVKLAPNDVVVRTMLGATYYYLDKDYLALSELLEAKRRKADNVGSYFWLGMVYHALEQFPAAIESYQRAIQLEPKTGNYHYQLGLTYVGMGRKEDALAVTETLRKLDPPRAAKLSREISTSFADPDTQDGNLTLGLKYFAEGPDSYSFALRAFRRVIVLKGATDYVSWASLAARRIGGIYRLQEKYQKAVEAYQQAIRFNPRDPDNQLALGRVYMAQGQKGKALEVQRILQTLDKAKAQELLGEINKASPAVPPPPVRFDGLYSNP